MGSKLEDSKGLFLIKYRRFYCCCYFSSFSFKCLNKADNKDVHEFGACGPPMNCCVFVLVVYIVHSHLNVLHNSLRCVGKYFKGTTEYSEITGKLKLKHRQNTRCHILYNLNVSNSSFLFGSLLTKQKKQQQQQHKRRARP